MTRLPLLALVAAQTAPLAAQTAPVLPDRPITRAEVQAGARRQFAAMDANHDGVVTPAEFAAFRARNQAAPAGDPFAHVGAHWFAHADANGDGRVTRAEAEARPLALFDTADLDHDGVISASERQVATMMLSLRGK